MLQLEDKPPEYLILKASEAYFQESQRTLRNRHSTLFFFFFFFTDSMLNFNQHTASQLAVCVCVCVCVCVWEGVG